MPESMNPLRKVFLVLESVVARQEKGATYSEILSELELPKSTVHRVLKDLTEIGYIVFIPETRKYFGSLRLAKLGAEVIANFQLRKHIRPFLQELHRETGRTANLAILDGTMGVFVDKIEAREFGIKLFSELGKTFPLYCTGLGKVFLAYSPSRLTERLLEKPLARITDRTIIDPDALRRELWLVRERGYAIDNEEITKGIICIAAPVFNGNDEIVAAVSVAFPGSGADGGGVEREIAAVTKCARLITESLSGLQQ